MSTGVDTNYFPMKQNDLRPYIQIQVFNPDGTPRDLSGHLINFHMGLAGAVPKINAAAVIVNGPQGIVEYRWQGTDTDTVGRFRAEFEIDGTDTYPKDGYIVVEFLPDVD